MNFIKIKQYQEVILTYEKISSIGKMPFTSFVPNKETIETIEKAIQGKELNICKNADDLFDKLGI